MNFSVKFSCKVPRVMALIRFGFSSLFLLLVTTFGGGYNCPVAKTCGLISLSYGAIK